MDTSKEYIEMCRKATEIQATWIIKEGDFSIQANDEKTVDNIHAVGELTTIGNSIEHVYCECSNGNSFHQQIWIWLPRQDQLQEMIGDFDTTIVDTVELMADMYDCLNEELVKYIHAGSWERFWLIRVMYINHGKTWNGNEWGKA